MVGGGLQVVYKLQVYILVNFNFDILGSDLRIYLIGLNGLIWWIGENGGNG